MILYRLYLASCQTEPSVLAAGRSAKLRAATRLRLPARNHAAMTVRRRVRRGSVVSCSLTPPQQRCAMAHYGSGQCLTPSTFRARREDRCPFRRRQSAQPAHQNASFLVFPDKIIAAVSINNSPMAETFAHLPACSLGRPLPFSAWSREYVEKEFWRLRRRQTQKERPRCETAGKARQVLVSVSLFRHTRVWTTSVPF